MNWKAPPHLDEAGWYILLVCFMVMWMWMLLKF
jgi:hypothetical protein